MTGSYCSPGWLGTQHRATQAGLEFTTVLLPQPLEGWHCPCEWPTIPAFRMVKCEILLQNIKRHYRTRDALYFCTLLGGLEVTLLLSWGIKIFFRMHSKRFLGFWFFVFFNLFYVCGYAVAVLRHQKRASDHIADGREPPCGCWNLNSGAVRSLNHLSHLSNPSTCFLRLKTNAVCFLYCPPLCQILSQIFVPGYQKSWC